MDHRIGNSDGISSNSTGYYCTNEEFIEIVMIMADFCCTANPQHAQEYTGLCNRLAEHLSTILSISMQPHTCFDDFRNASDKPTYMLTRKFVERIKELQQYPMLTESIRKVTALGHLTTITTYIERKQEAERITSILLPYIRRL